MFQELTKSLVELRKEVREAGRRFFPGEVPGSGKIGVGMVKGYTPRKINSWNLKMMVNASDDFAPVFFLRFQPCSSSEL